MVWCAFRLNTENSRGSIPFCTPRDNSQHRSGFLQAKIELLIEIAIRIKRSFIENFENKKIELPFWLVVSGKAASWLAVFSLAAICPAESWLYPAIFSFISRM